MTLRVNLKWCQVDERLLIQSQEALVQVSISSLIGLEIVSEIPNILPCPFNLQKRPICLYYVALAMSLKHCSPF